MDKDTFVVIKALFLFFLVRFSPKKCIKNAFLHFFLPKCLHMSKKSSTFAAAFGKSSWFDNISYLERRFTKRGRADGWTFEVRWVSG